MVSLACEATSICRTPIGMVSLLAEGEERVLACVGADVERVERASSLCAYTILEADLLLIEDAHEDARFRSNPFVAGPPYIRFYAGAPILDEGGLPLGAVCALGTTPGGLTSRQIVALKRIAGVVGAALEVRRRLMSADRDGRLDALLLTLVEPRTVI